jgi:DNA helicase MCM8
MGSLSARCSVVACANPPTGHYNRSRSIMENIRVSNAILSRFDLVFLLLDDPDLQRDKKLSEHVMKLHSRNRKRNLNVFEQGQDQTKPNQWEEQQKRLKQDPTLMTNMS